MCVCVCVGGGGGGNWEGVGAEILSILGEERSGEKRLVFSLV